MDGIGIKNLEFALSKHTRTVYQDNWQVGTGATTTTVPVVLRNPANRAVDVTGQIASDLQGARVEFDSGQNLGVSRGVSSADANGTLHLDTALPHVPVAGDTFTIITDVHVAVTVASPENIAQVAGTAQTPDDWTILLRNISGTGVPVLVFSDVSVLTAVNTAILGAAYNVTKTGTLNILAAIASGATATTLSITVDGAHYFVLNSGNNLNAGDLYSFSIPVVNGDTVNFETAAVTTLGILRGTFVAGQ